MSSPASATEKFLFKCWGIHSEIQSPLQTLNEIYTKNLLLLSTTFIDLNQCMSNCVESLKNVLQPEDYNLDETGLKTIDFHLKNFDEVLDGICYFEGSAHDIKRAFRISFCNVAEEKWGGIKAQSLYPIPSISDEEEKVDKKTELLRTCIWDGFALQKVEQSILDSGTSQGLFASTFKKV